MELDDELCLCFHVTKRKVVNFIRIEKPRALSQLSQCYGAGTGCGWCRVFLQRLYEARISGDVLKQPEPDAKEYASDRSEYVRSGKGTPPAGATPIS